MKNLSFFLCVLCFPGIFCSLNSVQLLAREVQVSAENVTVCLDRANASVAEIRELRLSVPEMERSGWREDFRKYGCFVACLYQKEGVMIGSKINAQSALPFINDVYDDNLDVRSDLQKILYVCEELVKNNTDECQVAILFRNCWAKWISSNDYAEEHQN